MSRNEAPPFHIRAELNRIQLAARLATRPEELKEAVETLALCVMGIMDSFGIHDIVVRQARIQRPGDSEATPSFIFEQRDVVDKVLRSTVVRAASLTLMAEQGRDS